MQRYSYRGNLASLQGSKSILFLFYRCSCSQPSDPPDRPTPSSRFCFTGWLCRLFPSSSSMRWHRPRLVLPGQRQLAITHRPCQVFHHRRRLRHVHLRLAQVCRPVIGQTPLAGFLVHNQCPVVGIGDIHKERVCPCRNVQITQRDVPIGLQRGSCIGPCSPHRIMRIVADEAISGEDMPLASLHPRRRVADGDRLPAHRSGCCLRRTTRSASLCEHRSRSRQNCATDQ